MILTEFVWKLQALKKNALVEIDTSIAVESAGSQKIS